RADPGAAQVRRAKGRSVRAGPRHRSDEDPRLFAALLGALPRAPGEPARPPRGPPRHQAGGQDRPSESLDSPPARADQEGGGRGEEGAEASSSRGCPCDPGIALSRPVGTALAPPAGTVEPVLEYPRRVWTR